LALTSGSRLGVYDVTAPIGEGGMGQVYRGRDTKLNRDVALKVLPDSFANDPDRLARFTREAQTLASLSHPNIAAIYGLEDSGGVSALVMELVEGEDLSQRIARGAIPIDEALPIAKQIAEALEAAHEQGVIHRDLKPANIKVRSDGTVKVLDFGLAKAMDPTGAVSVSNSMSPTITTPAMTQAGMILGTAAYMSPEQAKGRTVDRRVDVWAFGAVLFEILSGRQPFSGETVSETLAEVMKSEPPWQALPADVPANLARLIRQCLVKEPRHRIRDIGDVRLALDGAFETSAPPTRAPSPRQGTRLGWTVAAAGVLAAAVLAIPAVRYFDETLPAREMRVEINTAATDDPISLAISPDGRQVVFVASGDGASRLWLRSLASTTAQPLPGTEGAAYPFWSPDSHSIGFFASGRLYRIDIGAGPPQALTAAPAGRGGTWNADGTILFAPSISPGSIWRIAASGGEPTAVTRIDPPRQIVHRFPQFLPDSRHFLFHASGIPEASGIYMGSLDGGEPKRLTAADTAGAYLNPGWLVFMRQNALVTRRLDLQRAELTGDSLTVADPVGYDGNLNVGAFSVSSDNRVAYRTVGATRRQLAWFDRTGKALGVAGAPGADQANAPELSPDGRRVGIDRVIQGNRDVWLMDLVREGLTRFTFDPSVDGYPIWSPDDARVAFESRRKGSYDIWVRPSSGAGTEEMLLETPINEWPYDWSKDGQFLLYYQDGQNTGADLWALPMTGNDRKPLGVANTAFEESKGQFSPDGRWVAYETNESGRFEIVVQAFPAVKGKWQVSTGGGVQPRWRPDGKELYFIAPDRKLMAVTVAALESTFEVGTPMALFPTKIAGPTGPTNKSQYAVSRDGRFLIVTVLEDASAPITLLLNWHPEAKK
jgi:eukaryotic-like serine/threonine-protein kinase